MHIALKDLRLNWSYTELVVGCGDSGDHDQGGSAAVEFHLQRCNQLPNLSTHAVCVGC
jgi:hypothetical protein